MRLHRIGTAWNLIALLLTIITTVGLSRFTRRYGIWPRIRSGWHLLTWTRKNIADSDLVLEVGGGHNPHFRSDVLLDKFLVDDGDRNGPILVDRSFVQGDAEKLPFGDKAFDYVISRHIIEHLQHPDLFLEEISRVSKRGLLTCPHGDFEMIKGNPRHEWMVTETNNGLQLRQKVEATNNELGARLIDSLIGDYTAFYEVRDLIELRYEWEDRVNYSIVWADRRSREDFSHADDTGAEEGGPSNSRNSLEIFLLAIGIALSRTIFRRSSSSVDIYSLIVCPDCRTALNRTESAITCPNCGRVYPIRHGIPCML